MKKTMFKQGITSCMSVIIALLMAIISLNSFSQKGNLSGTIVPVLRPVTFPILCKPADLNNCNYIQNFDFNASVSPHHPDAPINMDQVLPWQSGSGTCAVYPGTNCSIAPPAAATSYVFGGAGFESSIVNESIVQKIPAVIPGHTYILSFFIAHKDYSAVFGTDFPLDHFNIHLINCDDYNNTFHPESYDYPPIPSNSQQIYCQDNVTNHAWQRVFVHFVAQPQDPAHPLNMIWIWPEEDQAINRFSGMFVALPELIDITDYGNQVQQGTPSDCMATLPDCGPVGSFFNWVGPNVGSTIIPPSPAGVPVTIDVSNPLNIGAWTLTLTVPGADITTGNCNTTGSFTTTVQVLACGNQIWPKVYYYAEVPDPVPGSGNNPWLVVSSGAGIFYGVTSHDMTTNINHNGGMVSSTPGIYTAQYDKISGVTTWINSNMLPKFALSSGSIQVLTSPATSVNTSIATAYYDQATGSSVSGPSNVPGNEIILAEDNGTYFTRSTNSLHIHSTSGNTSTAFISGAVNISRTIYNPATQHLFVQYQTGSASPIAVYSIVSNTLTLINSPMLTPFGYLQQVNNNDEVFLLSYYLSNLKLMKYDFVSNTSSLYTLPGFNNNDLFIINSCNPNAEDKLLAVPSGGGYIYAINTVASTFKKISYSYGIHGPGITYCFEGDDLYLDVATDYVVLTIGNQTIPTFGSISTGVTKFNLNVDFSRNSKNATITQELPGDKTAEQAAKPALSATLSPNPAKNILQLNIKEASGEAGNSFQVSINNSMGINVLTQRINQNQVNINVSQFKTGIYYVSISNDKGDKTTQIFMKE